MTFHRVQSLSICLLHSTLWVLQMLATLRRVEAIVTLYHIWTTIAMHCRKSRNFCKDFDVWIETSNCAFWI